MKNRAILVNMKHITHDNSLFLVWKSRCRTPPGTWKLKKNTPATAAKKRKRCWDFHSNLPMTLLFHPIIILVSSVSTLHHRLTRSSKVDSISIDFPDYNWIWSGLSRLDGHPWSRPLSPILLVKWWWEAREGFWPCFLWGTWLDARTGYLVSRSTKVLSSNWADRLLLIIANHRSIKAL